MITEFIQKNLRVKDLFIKQKIYLRKQRMFSSIENKYDNSIRSKGFFPSNC